jgi:hypothetical protein
MLAGCEPATPTTFHLNPMDVETPMTVEVITDPPGANISVNGDYKGKSPCTITMLRQDYFDRCARTYIVEAMPTFAGGYVQSREYRGPVPSRIFFDMRLGPVTPEVDVNVR